MTRTLAVLRPEPGARVTAAAIEAKGHRALRLPLFAVRPLAWEAPDPAGFDALLLTSANALRHAGERAGAYLPLPVYAVGEATADAARRRGFNVAFAGSGGAEALIAEAERRGVRRALHLAGRDRHVEAGGVVGAVVATYASEPVPVGRAERARLSGCVALLHSERAARRLAELFAGDGGTAEGITVAALSRTVADAAGTAWRAVAVADLPNDQALVDTALALAD